MRGLFSCREWPLFRNLVVQENSIQSLRFNSIAPFHSVVESKGPCSEIQQYRKGLFHSIQSNSIAPFHSVVESKGPCQTCQPSRIGRGNPRISSFPRIHSRPVIFPRIIVASSALFWSSWSQAKRKKFSCKSTLERDKSIPSNIQLSVICDKAISCEHIGEAVANQSESQEE